VDDQGRPITRDNYHVRVRLAGTLDPVSGKEVLVDPATGKDVVVPAKGEAKPRTDLIWVQARNGDVLDELPADDRAAGAIAEALFDEWKTRYLAEYLKREDDPNQTINVKLVVDAVTVKRDNNRGGFHVTGVRTDINPAGTLRLRDGDYIQLAVQNTSLASVPVFVTVLRIGRDGVFPIYPIKGAPNDSLAANRLEPAKTPYPLPFLVRATKPYGTDLYKVIATKEPADFSGLLARRRLPPGVGDKGEEAAKAQAELEKLPPPVHSLARLLQEVKDGRKGGEPVIIGTEWATDEKYVEVVAPGKN
ncbi:MAG TPA: hypothetical protein VFF52_13375, partial [Isosphaeraceae bacterium]|nr:hypothetical protein [Isosphaeraceae bacterium]